MTVALGAATPLQAAGGSARAGASGTGFLLGSVPLPLNQRDSPFLGTDNGRGWSDQE